MMPYFITLTRIKKICASDVIFCEPLCDKTTVGVVRTANTHNSLVVKADNPRKTDQSSLCFMLTMKTLIRLGGCPG